jgi:hypothetical protein
MKGRNVKWQEEWATNLKTDEYQRNRKLRADLRTWLAELSFRIMFTQTFRVQPSLEGAKALFSLCRVDVLSRLTPGAIFAVWEPHPNNPKAWHVHGLISTNSLPSSAQCPRHPARWARDCKRCSLAKGFWFPLWNYSWRRFGTLRTKVLTESQRKSASVAYVTKYITKSDLSDQVTWNLWTRATEWRTLREEQEQRREFRPWRSERQGANGL